MSKEFGKAVVVVGLMVGGIYAYTRWWPVDPAPAPSSPVRAVSLAAEEPAADAPHPVPSQEQQREEDLSGRPVLATVYECAGSAGRVLSDKPCADDARVLQVREPNGMVATPVKPRSRTLVTPPDAGPDAPPDTGESQPQNGISLSVVIPKLKTCEELNRSEKLVRERLRGEGSREYKQDLQKDLSDYIRIREEWKCGRLR